MDEKNYTGLIPENQEGKEIAAEHSVTLNDVSAAKLLYEQAKQRLLLVHNWGKIAGKLSADFQLTDDQGTEVKRLTMKGDHFRIDIAGPGSKAGEGYDWARVEDLKEVHRARLIVLLLWFVQHPIRKHQIQILLTSSLKNQPAHL
jgi:hypothetical protein